MWLKLYNVIEKEDSEWDIQGGCLVNENSIQSITYNSTHVFHSYGKDEIPLYDIEYVNEKKDRCVVIDDGTGNFVREYSQIINPLNRVRQ